MLDPLRRTLEVLSLESRESGRWALRSTHEGRVGVHASPFDSIELDLVTLWV